MKSPKAGVYETKIVFSFVSLAALVLGLFVPISFTPLNDMTAHYNSHLPFVTEKKCDLIPGHLMPFFFTNKELKSWDG